ncbi:MAG: hypothetical protein KJ060_15260 [Candidatus Hydrogenedentes bacterium]|nr:hypothetical protein [Candidatus Hydrogenedentota bacterium]
MRILLAASLCVLVVSCASDNDVGVVEKVKYDFGIGEKPEGYETGSDRVMSRLDAVGKTEMKRMNVEGRHGDIKFQEEGTLGGKYYKEVKVYEAYRPMDARAVSRTSHGERGYVGYVQYDFQVYQSPRVATRVEAEASSATIRTDVAGRETYRYNFGPSGAWDGGPGEETRD